MLLHDLQQITRFPTFTEDHVSSLNVSRSNVNTKALIAPNTDKKSRKHQLDMYM
jgi:hypothetical protein